MNRKVATAILTTVFAALGANSLNAQSQAIAKVPFPFHVRSLTLPAGTYRVEPVQNGGPLFTIADYHGHSIFVGAQVQGKSNPNDPKLTFSCLAGDCSLMRIELPGSSISHDLYPAKSPYKVGIATQVAVKVTH